MQAIDGFILGERVVHAWVGYTGTSEGKGPLPSHKEEDMSSLNLEAGKQAAITFEIFQTDAPQAL